MGVSDSRLLKEPWREIEWGAKNKLSKVRRYKPEGASHLRILLYGPVGAGKSSFVNTVAGVIKGQSVNTAAVSTSSESFTVHYRTHEIKMADCQKFPVVFSDVMGLESKGGARPDDIRLAMEGRVRNNYRFLPDRSLSPQNKEFYNPNPAIEDKVHVLVCMLDASKTDISFSVLEKMKEITESARDLGIPQVAVVTHIDEYHDEVKESVENVFRSKTLKETMTDFSADVGIPLNYIFPVWNNYEGLQKDSVDTLTLIALKNIMNYGDDFLECQKQQ